MASPISSQHTTVPDTRALRRGVLGDLCNVNVLPLAEAANAEQGYRRNGNLVILPHYCSEF